jgi:putative spermidine/putrescine transport system ATP-binding protein
MARLEIDRVSKRYGEVMRCAMSVSTLPMASSSCCSGRRAAARRRRCVSWRVSPSRPREPSGWGSATSPAYRRGKRNAGLVFQSYALFPHLTVAQNVAFGLEMRKDRVLEMSRRIADALRCAPRASGRASAAQLSGGQQQRVAAGPRSVFRPDVLLLD